MKQVTRKGANRSRLVAKIAGGAQMFGFNSNSEMVRVGGEKCAGDQKEAGGAAYSDSGGGYRQEFRENGYFLS